MENKNVRKLNVTVQCMAVYNKQHYGSTRTDI